VERLSRGGFCAAIIPYNSLNQSIAAELAGKFLEIYNFQPFNDLFHPHTPTRQDILHSRCLGREGIRDHVLFDLKATIPKQK